MRFLAGILAGLVIAASVACAAAAQPEVEVRTPRPFSGEKPAAVELTWRTDLQAARAEAAKAGRLTLIFFSADWCQPCEWMAKGTFRHPAVAELVQQQFVPVRVDDTKEPGEVSRKYSIRVYPTVLFLDVAGEPLHMIVQPRPPAEFLPALKRVLALASLIAAQKAKPDDLAANFAVGNAFASLEPLNAFAPLGQLKRAEPYLKRACDLDPANAAGVRSQALLILALVPLADGKPDDAVRNVADVLKTYPDAPETPVGLFFQGTILYQDGRFEDARTRFEELIHRYPKHPKAYEADKAVEAIDARLQAEKSRKDMAKQAVERAAEKAAEKPPEKPAPSDESAAPPMPPAAPKTPPAPGGLIVPPAEPKAKKPLG